LVHISNNDFVLLLGAGASAEPGLPTAFGMTDRFIETVRKTGDATLSRTLSMVLGGMQFLRGQQGIFPEPSFNIEDVVETVDVLRGRFNHRLTPFVGSWNELLRSLDGSRENTRDCLTELSELLRSEIKEWLATPPIGEIRHFQALQDFVRAFGGVDLFTLNYDLCIETALAHGDIPFTCGFESQGWNSELFQKPEIKIRVYKLHGSLDWYEDEEDKAIYSLQNPPKDRRPATPRPPLVIFGTAHKLAPTDPFLHLSYTFSECVKAVSAIVIIGYGFGDDYVNQIILQGLSRDSRKRMIVVGRTAADAQNTFQKRFSQAEIFLDAGRVEFVEGGARKVLNDGSLLETLRRVLTDVNQEGPF
jgi:SIR2-like domain